MKLALKVKLLTNEKESDQLRQVMLSFNRAANYVSKVAFDSKTFGQVNLHKLVYYEIKQQFNLSSQIAIRVIGKVTDVYKNKKQRVSQVEFREMGSIDYDTRNLTIKGNNVLSIMILGKRAKIQYRCKKPLSDFDLCCQSEVSFDKVKNKYFVTFFYDKVEKANIVTNEFIGVDLGIVNIATCSDGETFSGEKVENYRKKITSLKARLQEKGTKSAKRHLKKISKKEGLFKKDVNHCISKKLVSKAKALGVGLKLEELHFKTKKPVMKFTKKLRDNNAKLGKWAFGQLRTFISYKAKLGGIPVIMVNSAYTSQKCSKCGHTCKENRLTQSEFVCKDCGFSINADLNASINISRASINKPVVTDAELQTSRSLA
jgi:IS605 OrfB family transposase